MNEIEVINRAIESCESRLNMYKCRLESGVSIGHKEKLLRQIELEKKKIRALEKQMPKKVCYFLEDYTFETTCCGIDITNKDYTYCPNCGQLLGEVIEV